MEINECDFCGQKRELSGPMKTCKTCLNIILGIEDFVKTKKGKLKVLSALFHEFNKQGEPCSGCGKGAK
jgi:hypothetical protein